MKKFTGTILRVAGLVVLLLVLAWGLAAGYALVNRKALLKRTKTELSKQVRGGLSIDSMDLFFFHDFPYLTVGLSGVVLRDSLWTRHQHDLLRAEKIYIRPTLGSLFSGDLRFGKLFIEKGAICLFTDSTGYSNTSTLLHFSNPSPDVEGTGRTARSSPAGRGTEAGKAKSAEASKSGEKDKASVPDLYLDRVRLVIDKQNRRELVELYIRQFDCAIKKKERSLFLQVNTVLVINRLFFDTRDGSYLNDKGVTGRFSLQFNPASGILQGKNLVLQSEGYLFRCAGRFFVTVTPDPFNFSLQSEDISYKEATGLFPLHLREKLNEYAIDRPVSMNLTIDAGLADRPEPLVTARLVTGNLPGAFEAVGAGGSRENANGASGLAISYKGPLYKNESTRDSAASVRQASLELDSLRWEPFRNAFKNNR